MNVRRIFALLMIALLACVLPHLAAAQSLVSGDVTGMVTDASGAILPNATVTLKNEGTGQTQQSTTNAAGVYRFSLLPPGHYNVTAGAQGFQNASQTISVTVGQAATLNLQLAVGTSGTTVEVTGEGGLVQAQNGNISTTFTQEQVQLTPNPGNDLSYLVQTAPGAVMNTQAGYGNSATFGLPATSNLFTVNGMNENDPFLNTNNSGATNLLLGQNDVQEATVVNNGYSTQYGGLAGANVNYVTRSGTNDFHGNANYFWNGRAMNANSWFNKQAQIASGDPLNPNRPPFSNANQWSVGVGGPIIHDKTFFFVDFEGLRVLLPTSTLVQIPSPAFQTATLANLATTPGGAAQIPFYQQMFNLYNSAPGASAAQDNLPKGLDGNSNPVSGPGCPSSFTPFGDTTTACALSFRSTAGNATNEWLLTGRVDQNIGANDRLYAHFRTDHGLQATYTDPISPVFNAQSKQPQYEGQLNETHTFGNNAVNQFILATSWYSAVFAPANMSAATALMPFRLRFSGGTFYDLGRDLNDWPQGRNVTQYQLIDDYSKVIGTHNLKVGVNFKRNDITDYSPGFFTTGEMFGESLSSFYNGAADLFIQSFSARPTQPLALYSLGLYAQDEWAVRPNLKITLGLRGEHDSNPVCQTNCFARLTSDFFSVSHDINQPYNQAIQTGIHQALPSYTNIDWEPRFGFAWTPRGPNSNTVVRGGIGIFHDFFPATVADSFLTNSPLTNQFNVTGTLAPGSATSATAVAAGANQALLSAFSSGATYNQLLANPNFVVPSLFNSARSIHAPQYQEWNLEVQQGIGQKTTLSINYVGNHQIYGALQNSGVNAYCDATCQAELGATAGQFADLPTAPLDPRFGTVTQIASSNVGNYNGVTVSVRRRFSALQLQANYTFSHALDIVSNAGLLPYNFNTNTSLLNPQDPFNPRRYNYGNADYDVRHNASLNYVWTTPKMSGLLGALASWTISGTAFWRTGLPTTVYDDNATSVLSGFNFGISGGSGDPIFADELTGGPHVCTRQALYTPCLVGGTQFAGVDVPPGNGVNNYGQQRRNQIWGPQFFDTDLAIMKNFHIPLNEASNFSVGLQFFNLLNHPNFDQPDANLSSTTFGSIINTVSVPTSILGSFLGGDASPRLIQVKATLSF